RLLVWPVHHAWFASAHVSLSKSNQPKGTRRRAHILRVPFGFLSELAMSKQIERRDFIKQAAATTAAGMAFTASSYGRVLGANDRVRMGIIGPGARGQETMKYFLAAPNTEFVA